MTSYPLTKLLKTWIKEDDYYSIIDINERNAFGIQFVLAPEAIHLNILQKPERILLDSEIILIEEHQKVFELLNPDEYYLSLRDIELDILRYDVFCNFKYNDLHQLSSVRFSNVFTMTI